MDEADAADSAVRQAEAERLTMQRSANATGYRGVRKDCRSKSKAKPFFATVWRDGKTKYLGAFATAEEAALAYARAPEARAQVAAAVANPKPQASAAVLVNAEVVEIDEEDEEEKEEDEEMGHTGAADAADSDDSDDDSDDAAAAEEVEQERAGPKMSPAKQPRHTQPLRLVQPVPLPQRDAPAPQAYPKLEAAATAAAPAAPAAPAPVTFKHKLALLKRELEIEPATPAIPAVAEANQQMGITPSAGESLGVQLDRLLAIISS